MLSAVHAATHPAELKRLDDIDGGNMHNDNTDDTTVADQDEHNPLPNR